MGAALLLAGAGFGVVSLTLLSPSAAREGRRAPAQHAAVASA